MREPRGHPDCPAEYRVRDQASSLPSNCANLSRFLAIWICFNECLHFHQVCSAATCATDDAWCHLPTCPKQESTHVW